MQLGAAIFNIHWPTKDISLISGNWTRTINIKNTRFVWDEIVIRVIFWLTFFLMLYLIYVYYVLTSTKIFLCMYPMFFTTLKELLLDYKCNKKLKLLWDLPFDLPTSSIDSLKIWISANLLAFIELVKNWIAAFKNHSDPLNCLICLYLTCA